MSCLLLVESNFAGPLLLSWINLSPVWIGNHIPSKVWDEITYSLPNFNCCTVEVLEWISNCISHFIVHVVTYPCPKCKVLIRPNPQKYASPGGKYPRIDVDWTLIRHFRVRAGSNQHQSEGLCYLGVPCSHGRPVRCFLRVCWRALTVCGKQDCKISSIHFYIFLALNLQCLFIFLLLSHPGIPGVTLCVCTGSCAGATGRRFLFRR